MPLFGILADLDIVRGLGEAYLILSGGIAIGLCVVYGKIMPSVASLGREEYRTALNTVTSPVVARAAELVGLTNELKARATTTESIVREVDVLFAQLREEIATRQAEQTALMQQQGRGRRVLDLTQQQVDDLLLVWDERHAKEKTREKWRDLAFTVLGALIALGLTIGWELLKPAVLG